MEIHEHIDENSNITKTEIAFPGPVSNRFLVTYSTKFELGNGSHAILTFTPNNYHVDSPEGTVLADMKFLLIVCEPVEG